jgi:hypothetical protein
VADNTDKLAKIAIRRWALEQAGGAKARVLELYGGKGVMYDACYTNVAKHLAFDVKPIERDTWLQGDNRVLLPHYVNDGWTLYDADAYNNPWQILSDVCRLRHKGRFVLVATCLVHFPLQGNLDTAGRQRGGLNKFMRYVTGYGSLPAVPLLSRFYWDIVRQVFGHWRSYGVSVLAAKHVHARAAASVNYYALVAEKS